MQVDWLESNIESWTNPHASIQRLWRDAIAQSSPTSRNDPQVIAPLLDAIARRTNSSRQAVINVIRDDLARDLPPLRRGRS